jgi:hypothetical protein
MCHQHAACALIELMEIGKTPSGPNPVFHHAPETFNRIEVMARPNRQEIQAKLLVPVRQRGRELVGAVDATAVNNHDDLLPSVAKERHHLMDISHVQGVGLNHAIFACEEVIFSRLRVKDGQKCPCKDSNVAAIVLTTLCRVSGDHPSLTLFAKILLQLVSPPLHVGWDTALFAGKYPMFT